jgi:hypothetical protein
MWMITGMAAERPAAASHTPQYVDMKSIRRL